MEAWLPQITRHRSTFSKLARASQHKPSFYKCRSCMRKEIRHSTRAAQIQDKPYYITTPIFYVNAAPHVGHLYTLVLTDILKRWQLLNGKKAILCTGTDEHGMKIQRAAAKAESDPKSFCDKGAEVFKTLAEEAGVSNDHFVRTTDHDHREAVQYIWQMLQDRGYIYTSKHEGWYCVSEETFYPESGVQLIQDPKTGKKIMVSIETGKEVEWTSESNHHFRLSAFREKLLALYESNPSFIVPDERRKQVVNSVKETLEDLSISRPRQRLSWGIPVPGGEDQTIYVWLDALINYLTKAGYPWTPGKESLGGWPADVHVVGKDIIRFHCIYWPAFLMALDLPLPRQILTHAHWTLGHEKMAKSTGNVVNPFFALDRFGVDVMRFYLAHDGGIADDADYGNPYIIKRYKKCLQGALGNLSSRITRGKSWSVHRAVEAAHGRSLPPPDEIHTAQRKCLELLTANVTRHFEELNPGAAAKAIMDTIFEANRFLTCASPWDLAKSESPRDKSSVDATIYLCAETLRITGILFLPYMPNKAAQLLDMLGVAPERRTLAYAILDADSGYGHSMIELGKGADSTLFPPLTSDK